MTHHRLIGDPSGEFADDEGRAAAGLRDALAAAASGDREPYLAAVAELCLSRLLIPVVARTADEPEDHRADPPTGHAPQHSHGHDRHAEMSAVLLRRSDGTRAVLAFTGLDALTAWDGAARPVPATLDRVAQAALSAGAGTVVVDLAGPAPLLLERPLLDRLGRGHRFVRLDDGWGWLVPEDTAPTEE